MLVRDGIILIKYWFSVSDAEQERRFQARIEDPTKRWKLSPMDLQSRTRWVEYSMAKDEMFRHTDIRQAPWYVVRGDDKKRARLNVISHLLSLIPYEDLTPPPIALPPREPDRGYVRPADRRADLRARARSDRVRTARPGSNSRHWHLRSAGLQSGRSGTSGGIGVPRRGAWLLAAWFIACHRRARACPSRGRTRPPPRWPPARSPTRTSARRPVFTGPHQPDLGPVRRRRTRVRRPEERPGHRLRLDHRHDPDRPSSTCGPRLTTSGIGGCWAWSSTPASSRTGPAARPYLYVYYVYDAPPGQAAPVWNDACPASPNGPGANLDGCVVTAKLARYTVDLGDQRGEPRQPRGADPRLVRPVPEPQRRRA